MFIKKNIQKIIKKGADEIPLAIMVSDDTHDLTVKIL